MPAGTGGAEKWSSSAVRSESPSFIGVGRSTSGDDAASARRPTRRAGWRAASPASGPDGADVEERAPRGDGAAHPDDGAHRAERREERQRDEERERRVDLVDARRDVVPELVREEDGEERRPRSAAVRAARPTRATGSSTCPRVEPVTKTLATVATKSSAWARQRRGREPRRSDAGGEPRRQTGSRASRRAAASRSSRGWRRASMVPTSVCNRSSPRASSAFARTSIDDPLGPPRPAAARWPRRLSASSGWHSRRRGGRRGLRRAPRARSRRCAPGRAPARAPMSRSASSVATAIERSSSRAAPPSPRARASASHAAASRACSASSARRAAFLATSLGLETRAPRRRASRAGQRQVHDPVGVLVRLDLLARHALAAARRSAPAAGSAPPARPPARERSARGSRSSPQLHSFERRRHFGERHRERRAPSRDRVVALQCAHELAARAGPPPSPSASSTASSARPSGGAHRHEGHLPGSLTALPRQTLPSSA